MTVSIKSPLETLRSMADELERRNVSAMEPQFLFLTRNEIQELENDFIAKGFNHAIKVDLPKNPPGAIVSDFIHSTVTTCGYSFMLIRHSSNSGNYEWHKRQ